MNELEVDYNATDMDAAAKDEIRKHWFFTHIFNFFN